MSAPGRPESLQRVCRLCLAARPLRRSHVIPEFLFRLCYDELHRGLQIDRRPIPPRYLQKGWRERLLCDDCEQFLNEQYEKPMKAQWIEAPKLPTKVRTTPVHVQGLDYRTFKLFHLAVLWRAAVASTGDFAQINLGPHAERIRQMLLRKDPGSPDRYPLFAGVLVLPQNSEPAYDVVVPPSITSIEGQPLYQTVYGGCVWGIAVASHSLPEKWRLLMLSDSGGLLATAHDFRTFWTIRSALASYQANRQRFGWSRLPELTPRSAG